MKASGSNQKYFALDAMRGVAAIVVVLVHVCTFFGGLGPRNGYLAVDFFFGLSGFILANSYESRFRHGLDWRAFLIKRVIRLYPLYFLGIFIGLLTFLVMYFGKDHFLFVTHSISIAFVVSTVCALFFLPSPIRILSVAGHPFPLDHPTWSLFFEIFVNFCYAKFFLKLNKTHLLYIIGSSAFILTLGAIVYNDIDFGWKAINFIGGVPRVLFSFFLGVLIFRYPDLIDVQFKVHPLALIACVLAILIAPIPANLNSVYTILSVFLFFPLLLILGIRADIRSRNMNSVFTALGSSSYAIYVLHVPMAMAFAVAWRNFSNIPITNATTWVDITFLVSLFLICLFLDRVYDGPVRAVLNRRFFGNKTELPVNR